MRPSRPSLQLLDGSKGADAHGGPLTTESIFQQYRAYVTAIAVRLLARQEDADDVTQDVFLKAHTRLLQLRSPAAVKGWLATTTVRLARRRLRRRRFLQALGFR